MSVIRQDCGGSFSKWAVLHASPVTRPFLSVSDDSMSWYIRDLWAPDQCKGPMKSRECSSGQLTFIIEAVDAVDAGTLVVPTEQKEILRVFDLIGQQQADGLQRLLATVHIVPQEKVVALWGEATILKQP